MKPQKAIQTLERQRDKINDPKHPNNDTWKVQTASHIKDFFGEKSDEYAHIRQFSFSVFGHTGMSKEQWRNEMDMNKRRIVQFLDTCIETINDKGLYKPRKKNFLSDWSELQLLKWAIPIATGIFISGMSFSSFIIPILSGSQTETKDDRTTNSDTHGNGSTNEINVHDSLTIGSEKK